MSDESNFDVNEISQKQVIDHISNNDEKNFASDIGHSYSYIPDDDAKVMANLLYVKPKLSNILNDYHDIIKNDSGLYQKLSSIEEFFKQNSAHKIDKKLLEETFHNVLNVVEQVAEEEQRIIEESPTISKNDYDISTRLFELKSELLKIKEECLETY